MPARLSVACPLPWWKRTMDITGAIAGLLLLSPLFAAIAILIKIVSPGPVFFSQTRVGHMGTSFRLHKFRTMHADADMEAHRRHVTKLIEACDTDHSPAMLKMDCDTQIIPCGRILRMTCLDELPQLINVLAGDMTLVGPRPAIPYEVEVYAPWHTERFDAKPGMTGLWQVSGKNRLSFNEMVRLDVQYARHLSFCNDVRILLKTAPAIWTQIKGNRRRNDGP